MNYIGADQFRAFIRHINMCRTGFGIYNYGARLSLELKFDSIFALYDLHCAPSFMYFFFLHVDSSKV